MNNYLPVLPASADPQATPTVKNASTSITKNRILMREMSEIKDAMHNEMAGALKRVEDASTSRRQKIEALSERILELEEAKVCLRLFWRRDVLLTVIRRNRPTVQGR